MSTALIASELGHEHLGKYMTVPSLSKRRFQLLAVVHTGELSGFATLDNPTPPLTGRTWVCLRFNGVADANVTPGTVVQVFDAEEHSA